MDGALVSAAVISRRRLIRLVTRRWTVATRSLFDSFPIERGDVVMLGDSITAAGPWSEMFPGVRIKNRGISGDTTSDVLARISQVKSGPPAAVFLMVGTNDLGSGAATDQVLATYADILTELEPVTRVYVQSVLPRQARYAPRVRRLNVGLAQLAASREHRYIDLFELFAGGDGSLRKELSPDRLHLVGTGYEVWRSAIVDAVAEAAQIEPRR